MAMIANPIMAKRAAELLAQGFVVIDFETTGFPSEPGAAIIEVAAINHRGETLLNTLINPERRIPYAASKVNGIYDKDVLNAPTFAQVYDQLAGVLEGQRAIAYNHEFEKGMLAVCCRRHELALPATDWSCAMRAYAKYRGLRWFTKLTAACATEGIVVENAHRALGDCKLTLALMYTMATI
jgi:DNA polymerase-3 subunit epsilon